MNREEDTIDLGRLLSIIVANKKVTGGIVAICTVLAVIVAFILPKTYTSSVMVQTGSSKSAISSGAAALAAMHLYGGRIGAELPLNCFTAGVSLLLGVPGVTLLTVLLLL